MPELNHAWIAAHIPHRGAMCLLACVQRWDAQEILCAATSHRATDNPLRAEGRLGIAAGIEYAAQAMAVHGVLLAGGGTPLGVGYLTSVRDVQLHATRLDDRAGALQVRAERLSGDERLILYRFDVRAEDGTPLLDGRASVVLDAAAL
ncbi:Predicted 3-hydroxylacyl-ACP dehydratase, HotDog domain [Oryzisolibacter propanilivorax]|uniref:Predicted 3-hydroxylacyl-ACP dehydratase, HotDog domain n=1 Tax=Oryzisolibacter propanilivorax TaxID=1527607 RepID=A0A1G9QFI1_9BURK|nr:3-hydroxylacyl-ACP dehydratase [Oryzisolibacter propanilivorax]SDM09743.1 Predicted 3-hydroxylacyl-ACP dehydratase, HotDog domain [Oryzisolibacter propanilivorax]